MNLHLDAVNAKNMWELLDLKVTDAQEKADFVASNTVSILEAYTVVTAGGHAVRLPQLGSH